MWVSKPPFRAQFLREAYEKRAGLKDLPSEFLVVSFSVLRPADGDAGKGLRFETLLGQCLTD